jgi:cysteine desulfurase
MHANNEVGTMQPLEEIAQIAHEAGIFFHTDAAQSVGKIKLAMHARTVLIPA